MKKIRKDAAVELLRKALKVNSNYSADRCYDVMFVFGLDITSLVSIKQVYKLLKTANPNLPIILVGGEKDWLKKTYWWRWLALCLRAPFNKKARLAFKSLTKESGMERMLRIAKDSGYPDELVHRADDLVQLPDIIRRMALINCHGKALIVVPQRWALIFKQTADYMLRHRGRFDIVPMEYDLLVIGDGPHWHNLLRVNKNCLLRRHYARVVRDFEKLDGKTLRKPSVLSSEVKAAAKRIKTHVGICFYWSLYFKADRVRESENNEIKYHVFD